MGTQQTTAATEALDSGATSDESNGDFRAQVLAGTPAVERRLTLAGIETSVLEGGEGSPLVLLHGPGEFAGKWLRILPDLVETHRVIAPDLPAHGASGLPSEPIDEEQLITWLDELVEQTSSSPPLLVGHVLGGSLAARYAIRHSDRISRLVLVDTMGLARFRPAPKFGLTLIGFQARPNERSFERFMRQCSYDFDGLREEMGEKWEPFAAYGLQLTRGPNAKVVFRMLRRVGMPRIPAEQLERITVPTHLIWGRQDRANRLRIAERASERYDWPLHVIEDCADDPPRDRPQEFLEALYAAVG